MVAVVWAIIFLSLGFLGFLLVPMLAGAGPVEWRVKIGRWMTDLSMKSFGELALVDRVVGGYDLLKIGVDDNKKMASVTVSSGIISDDKQVLFEDVDDRIKRLQGKPCCEVVQGIPAAISPELSEIGHWVREKDSLNKSDTCTHCAGSGMHDGAWCEACNGSGEVTAVDPYVDVDPRMRVTSPRDVMALPGCSVEPETINTCETLTKQRFSEYAGNIGAVEMGATFISFGVGAAGVAGLQYLKSNVLDSTGGGGAGGTTNPVPIMLDTTMTLAQSALDAGVMLL